jgi:hypothetical protein
MFMARLKRFFYRLIFHIFDMDIYTLIFYADGSAWVETAPYHPLAPWACHISPAGALREAYHDDRPTRRGTTLMLTLRGDRILRMTQNGPCVPGIRREGATLWLGDYALTRWQELPDLDLQHLGVFHAVMKILQDGGYQAGQSSRLTNLR